MAKSPLLFALTASSISSTSGSTLSRKRAFVSSEKPGCHAADRILAREARDRESEAPERTLQLLPCGHDVGEGRAVEHRQASEEVDRDPL